MSTTTAAPTVDVRHAGDRSLAIALGVARPAPAAVRVPTAALRVVAGQSPLEAWGWASTDPTAAPTR
ncbi:hypothetical protein AB6N23_02570 [Cellulomonas sp. 179-A 9B4 NHS]|uniref:hypothetical protein n=1 Tax=Cellulomonas sp. 179-A 9B4 NHS TaxID=3142379 RepID=UPI0039A3505F